MDEALVQYQKAVELKPQSANYRSGLGDAYRRKGIAREDMACYQKAIELARQQGETDLVEKNTQLLQLYFSPRANHDIESNQPAK